MVPYWLIAGLTPAQGAAAGAFMAVGMGGSSIAAFKGTDHMPRDKRLLVTLVTVAIAVSLVGPFFLPYVNAETYKPILAILTLVSLPLLFIKQRLTIHHKVRRTAALALIGVLLLACSFMPSSAFWVIIAAILTQLLGFSVLEGVAMRRILGLVQSAIVFIILMGHGSLMWQHAVVALLGGSIGSYLGTRYSIRKGERFAKYALAGGAFISAVVLVI